MDKFRDIVGTKLPLFLFRLGGWNPELGRLGLIHRTLLKNKQLNVIKCRFWLAKAKPMAIGLQLRALAGQSGPFR